MNTVNQLKSIFITFLCSYWVINGKITFGVMLSIGYMVGQLMVPLQDIMLFFQDLQDARTSFERLNEIQLKANENDEGKLRFPPGFSAGFNIINLSFKYPGIHNQDVLRGINLFIPGGKITAIVGTSGSGKTTLMKLLLAFYQPQKGEILIGKCSLERINTDDFRSQCGVVMQDAYIYNSSIAQNISLAYKDIDIDRVYHALKIACLDEFVRSLPLKHNTLLGNIGLDLSGGQKQRLFIARAVYKNPGIIFLDEATNSLDANNERGIMNNLEEFFIGKTVLVIAHRLSTVKNAAQIVVLDKGEIVEVGTHAELARNRGKYYELVKNQLELGR
jgi:ATP-binding cassette subfamily B protein